MRKVVVKVAVRVDQRGWWEWKKVVCLVVCWVVQKDWWVRRKADGRVVR